MKRRPLGADGLADLGILAGGVRLELQPQLVAVLIPEEVDVAVAHRLEDRGGGVRRFASLPGSVFENLTGLLETRADGGEEQVLLGRVELEEVRLRDTDALRDRQRRRAGVAAGGELLDRGRDDRLATLVGSEPGLRAHD